MTVEELFAASPSPAATTTSTSSEPPGHAKVLNDDTVSPGWLGLVVFLALGLATVLLLRSFRHQLTKVPKRFDDPPSVASLVDLEGRPLVLFQSPWHLERAQRENPALTFVAAVQPGRAKTTA